MRHRTINELLLSIDEQQFNLDALVVKEGDDYKTLTYGELITAVRALANGLLERGIQKGDKIGIMSENRAEWPVVYLAVTSIGAIIAPISILWEPPELETVAKTGDLKMIFTSPKYLEKINAIIPNVPTLKQVICFHSPLYRELEQTQGSFPAVRVEPGDIAEILFVSGKMGVMLSHGAIMSNAHGLFQTIGFSPEPGKKLMMSIPFSHLYPTVFGILLPLMGRWTAVTSAEANMARILRMIKETRPHYIVLVPLILERFYNRLQGRIKKKNLTLENVGLDDLECIFVAGVKCPEELITNVETLGLPVLEGYGVSEMAPFITINTLPRRRTGSAGLALSNVELKIHQPDAEGNGEVIARGPNMMSGYYKMPEIQPEMAHEGGTYINPEGWLHTGDIGRIDKDGFLFITGRLRNIIVSKGGTNIYSREIENKLSENPYIAEVRIVAKQDDINGEYPYAYIRPTPGLLEKPRDLDHIIQDQLNALSGKIAAYKIPRAFEIIS